MKKLLDVLAILAVGAAVMSGFDPTPPHARAARRRRRNEARANGAPAAARAAPTVAAPAVNSFDEDERLRERLRARLARVVSRPRTVDVDVQHGEVRLRGRVLAQEVDRLTSMVWSTPGVESIENRLAVER